MYNYNEIIDKLNIENNIENRKCVKAIVNALIKNNDAIIYKQKFIVKIDKVAYLWSILKKMGVYFDYKYNTKIDLTNFFYYVLNDKPIIINAIFCPGYTKTGYKNYVGNNNTSKLIILKLLKQFLEDNYISAEFKITLANIFLENTNNELNPNWENELKCHIEKFIEKATIYFEKQEIIILSNLFTNKKYIKGFIDNQINIKNNKTYQNFYKNNLDFYKRMGWSKEEIQIRNDKLFTIYNIISDYINTQINGVYIPMENMYSRSKVMTENKVCTMYLHK